MKTPSVGDEDEPDEVLDNLVRQAQQLVGELIWISSRTRCDLSYAVSLAANMLTSKPAAATRRCHRIHRYLRRTFDYRLQAVCGEQDEPTPELDKAIRDRLEFDNELWPGDQLSRLAPDIQIKGYGDASFCGEASRSTTGVIIMVGTMACAWRSRKQVLPNESSTEAEMIAQNEAAAVGLSITEFIREVGFTPVYAQRCDNRSTIGQIAGGQSWRTRSLSCRSRALRQKIMLEQIFLSHLAGKRFPADGLTKGLAKIDHQKFLNLTCVGSPSQDDRFDLMEDLSVLPSSTLQLPEEHSARTATVVGKQGQDALRSLSEWGRQNRRLDVMMHARALLQSLSSFSEDSSLTEEEKDF